MVRLHGQIAPGKFVEVNLAGLHTQDNEPKVDQNLITFPTWLSHVEVWSLQSNQRLLKTWRYYKTQKGCCPHNPPHWEIWWEKSVSDLDKQGQPAHHKCYEISATILMLCAPENIKFFVTTKICFYFKVCRDMPIQMLIHLHDNVATEEACMRRKKNQNYYFQNHCRI